MERVVYKFERKNLLTLKAKLIIFRHSKLFSFFTTFVIVFYSLILGLKTHINSPLALEIFSYLDTLVTLYFAFEIGIKIYSEDDIKNFFKDKWNVFDFVIVIASLIPVSFFDSIVIARLLRIFRVLRLIALNDSIKKILTALEGAIPAIANIVILMFIVFYTNPH